MNAFEISYEIDKNWSNYDKSVAISHLANFGFIIIDSIHKIPVDNEYEVEEFIEYIKQGA